MRVEVGGKLRGLSQVYVSCGCKVDSVYGKLGKVLLYRQQICDSRGAGMEGRDIRNGLLCSALLCSALLLCRAVLCGVAEAGKMQIVDECGLYIAGTHRRGGAAAKQTRIDSTDSLVSTSMWEVFFFFSRSARPFRSSVCGVDMVPSCLGACAARTESTATSVRASGGEVRNPHIKHLRRAPVMSRTGTGWGCAKHRVRNHTIRFGASSYPASVSPDSKVSSGTANRHDTDTYHAQLPLVAQHQVPGVIDAAVSPSGSEPEFSGSGQTLRIGTDSPGCGAARSATVSHG